MTGKQILRPIATVLVAGIGCYSLYLSLFAEGDDKLRPGYFVAALFFFTYAAVLWYRKLKS